MVITTKHTHALKSGNTATRSVSWDVPADDSAEVYGDCKVFLHHFFFTLYRTYAKGDTEKGKHEQCEQESFQEYQIIKKS